MKSSISTIPTYVIYGMRRIIQTNGEMFHAKDATIICSGRSAQSINLVMVLCGGGSSITGPGGYPNGLSVRIEPRNVVQTLPLCDTEAGIYAYCLGVNPVRDLVGYNVD